MNKEILGTKAEEKFTLSAGALTIHDVDYIVAAAFNRLQTSQEREVFIQAHLRVRSLKEQGVQVVQKNAEHDRMVGNNSAPSPTEIGSILDERGSRYGKFIAHATITQLLKDNIRKHLANQGRKLEADHQEALDMICHKIGRIVNGDPNYADSWIDIAGYAKLVADKLEGVTR